MAFLRISCILESFVNIDLSAPIAVVTHDAGGAEVLSSYVAHHQGIYKFVLEGPALKIFERKLGTIPQTPLPKAIETCNSLLCGTSGKSELEWRAIAVAKAARKPAIAFLDHWVNYRKRFIRRGLECLPDAIWVGDDRAEEIARNTFPETPVQLVPNPYFDDIRKELSKIELTTGPSVRNGLRVLFVCSPVNENSPAFGYTEFDALRYFFSNRFVLGAQLENLVIRPHPSEESGKYSPIAAEFGEWVCLGGDKPLLQEIAESDVVIGCGSMAMVVALVAGRRVISAIPPGGRPSSLPQPEIESLQQLLRDGLPH